MFTPNGKSQYHKIPISEISLIGKHNMVNGMAAVLSTLCLGLTIDKIQSGLKTFENAPHRLEHLGLIDGIAYVNDSKATNVDAVYYALEGLPEGIIWIAGGIDKGNDYDQIAELVEKKVVALICLGKDNQHLTSYFGSRLVQIVEVQDTDTAVRKAQTLGEVDNIVLLSPACSSFDLFNNYEDRGNQFRQSFERLKKTYRAIR